MNESSHPYNLITLIPHSTSLIDLLLKSFSLIKSDWLLLQMDVIQALKGRRRIMKAVPAIAATPSCCHSRYTAIPIWSGDDQETLMKIIMSVIFCASTAIKFTICPVVYIFLVSGDNLSAFRYTASMTADLILVPSMHRLYSYRLLMIDSIKLAQKMIAA